MNKILTLLFLLASVGSSASVVRADIVDRLFDFTDAYYAANGVNVARIINRRQVTGNGNSVFDTPNTVFQRNVRVARLNPAYADNGRPTFWAVMGDLDATGFTNDEAGRRAKAIADRYTLYVFPTRTGNQIGLGNNRQADIVDLSGGYFSNDPLGLWLHTWVSYTDAAFNTKEGKRALDDLQKRNGLALDGTPMIKTLSELNNLFSKGFAVKRLRKADGSEGPMYGICPVIKDPTDGGIAPGDTLANVKKADGSALESELLRQFLSLQQTWNWAN